MFVILLSLFRIRKFQGYIFICRNAEGVQGQRMVGTPWTRPI